MRVIRAQDLAFVPASHENPLSAGVFKKVLLSREDLPAGRLMMLNWARLPVGKAFQKHYHEDMDEVFLILEGSAEMHAGDDRRQVAPGDLLVIPERVPHFMRNTGSVDVQYVVFGISREQGGRTITI